MSSSDNALPTTTTATNPEAATTSAVNQFGLDAQLNKLLSDFTEKNMEITTVAKIVQTLLDSQSKPAGDEVKTVESQVQQVPHHKEDEIKKVEPQVVPKKEEQKKADVAVPTLPPASTPQRDEKYKAEDEKKKNAEYQKEKCLDILRILLDTVSGGQLDETQRKQTSELVYQVVDSFDKSFSEILTKNEKPKEVDKSLSTKDEKPNEEDKKEILNNVLSQVMDVLLAQKSNENTPQQSVKELFNTLYSTVLNDEDEEKEDHDRPCKYIKLGSGETVGVSKENLQSVLGCKDHMIQSLRDTLYVYQQQLMRTNRQVAHYAVRERQYMSEISKGRNELQAWKAYATRLQSALNGFASVGLPPSAF